MVSNLDGLVDQLKHIKSDIDKEMIFIDKVIGNTQAFNEIDRVSIMFYNYVIFRKLKTRFIVWKCWSKN